MNFVKAFKSNFFSFPLEGVKKYTKNTGWIFVARFVVLVVSFVTVGYVAKYLGPAQFGVLGYARNYIAIFAVIASLGIDQVLFRELVHKDEEERNKLLGSAFFVKTIAAFLLTGIAILGSFWGTDQTTTIVISIMSILVIFQPFNVVAQLFHAEVRSKYESLSIIVGTVLFAILKLGAVYWGLHLYAFAFLIMGEAVIYNLLYLYFFTRAGRRIFSWQVDRVLLMRLVRDSWPFFLTAIFSFAYARVDILIIKHLMTDTDVGIYDVAVRISEFWYFIPGVIASSVFPALVNAKNSGEQLYNQRLKQLFVFMIFLSVGISIFVAILAHPVISLLFGSSYEESISIVYLYVWAGVGITLIAFAEKFLLIENYGKILLLVSFVGMAINIGLNFWLIPKYGLSGAAVATLISYNLTPLMVLFFKDVRKNLALFLFRTAS